MFVCLFFIIYCDWMDLLTFKRCFVLVQLFRDNIFNKDDNIYKSEALHKEGQTNERQQIKSFGLIIQEIVLM